jgi:cysteine desulfurase family protein (TIGR01976 family)
MTTILNSLPRADLNPKLDLTWVRSNFPSLSRLIQGQPAAFLDGPGGTQVTQSVIDAVTHYLKTSNANTHGAFATSSETDELIAGARSAIADLLGSDPEEIVFGPNMTTLTFAVSRSIGRELGPGDEILVTNLDHSANVSPWQALEERGVKIQFADIREQDCTLDMDDLARKLSARTKVVAAGYASNAVGTINDAKTIIRMAHDVGAMAYIDAVHYAPHRLIDVRDLDCDFLACSTYKFFGPHVGALYGKRELLESLHPYKVRPNTDAVPGRWEMGTLNHEGMAGVKACVDYLAELGRRTRAQAVPDTGAQPGGTGPAKEDLRGAANLRRDLLRSAYRVIHSHEHGLSLRMLRGLGETPSLRLYGISDPSRIAFRCPTFAIRMEGHPPAELSRKLGDRGIFTWDGNYYALSLTERLGVERDGGLLRIGFVHYNSEEEVDRVLEALRT